MTDKFISDYTNETAPSASNELLIDQGSGAYKALSLTSLAANMPAITTSALQVNGLARIDNNGANATLFQAKGQHGGMSLVDVNSAWAKMVWGNSNDSAYVSANIDAQVLSLQALSNGNVGIGTTAPSTKLEVAGTVSASALQVNGAISMASSTLSTGGIGFGTDVNLYRSAADTLKTDDRLEANDFGLPWSYAGAGFSTTITGCASNIQSSIKVKKIGKFVHVVFYVEGVSNADTFSFTVPYANVQSSALAKVQTALGLTYDNGAYLTTTGKSILDGSTVNLYTTNALGLWTTSGLKAASGTIIYETN